jgi:hypothetical protein
MNAGQQSLELSFMDAIGSSGEAIYELIGAW